MAFGATPNTRDTNADVDADLGANDPKAKTVFNTPKVRGVKLVRRLYPFRSLENPLLTSISSRTIMPAPTDTTQAPPSFDWIFANGVELASTKHLTVLWACNRRGLKFLNKRHRTLRNS